MLGQASGLTKEQIVDLAGDYENSPHFTEAEKAVLAWAEAITRNTSHEDDRLFQRMANHFTAAEIVDITVAAAMFNMLNRLKQALGVAVEPPAEVEKIGGTLKANLPGLRDYYLEAARAVTSRMESSEPASE